MISVIILAFNSAKFVCDAVDSVLADRQLGDFAEVVVLDNASGDSTSLELSARYEGARGVCLARTDIALGYAGGNNAAARLTTGDILLILNDDCVLERGTLTSIAKDFADDSELGILQCAIATADGSHWDSLGHSMDSWGFLSQLAGGKERKLVPAIHQEVFGASGAAFAIRRDLFTLLGGFDEAFGYLFEETDLCWRARLLGYKVAISGGAVARHRQLARYAQPYPGREGSPFYLLTRNRIRSMLKNFSLRHLLTGATVHMLLLLLYSLGTALRGDVGVAKNVLHAFWWNILQLRSTLNLRRQIQSKRVVSDGWLIKSGRILRPSPRRLLRHAM